MALTGLKGLKKAATPKGKKITHYGGCGPGQIRDHNKGSKTYGKCIDILAKK